MALAVAKARETPGTGMVGLEIAAALSCVAGHSRYGPEVLAGMKKTDQVILDMMISK